MNVLLLVGSLNALEGKGKEVQEVERHDFSKLQDQNKTATTTTTTTTTKTQKENCKINKQTNKQ